MYCSGHGINEIKKHAYQMKDEITPIGQVYISNNFVYAMT